VALARISGAPPNLNAKLLGHIREVPPALRREILRIAEQQSISAASSASSIFDWENSSPTPLFPLAAHFECRHHALRSSAAMARPSSIRAARFRIWFANASTLQIGEPSVIAARMGITTVGDFRPADIALGGQGAPLVPYADYLLYRHEKFGRVSLNLGGIANITVLPRAAKPQQVFAFDTGPANMLIDALVTHFTRGRRRFDENAHFAAQGRSIPALLNELLRDSYLKLPPQNPPVANIMAALT